MTEPISNPMKIDLREIGLISILLDGCADERLLRTVNQARESSGVLITVSDRLPLLTWRTSVYALDNQDRPWAQVCSQRDTYVLLRRLITQNDRSVVLQNALEQYKTWAVPAPFMRFIPEFAEATEHGLAENLRSAKEAMDKFFASHAAWEALNEILPGWFYVDASDHLPKSKWHAFVSNSRLEWVEWLIDQGMDPIVADRLVREQAPKNPGRG